MSTVAVREPAPRAAARPTAPSDRVFYGTIAVGMGLTVFAGFAPTYYFRLLSGGPTSTISGGPFTALVHLHGALFTSWVVLFIVQTVLISARRVSVHRRLGVAGAVLASAMVAVGTITAVATAKRGGAPPGIEPLAFLAIPLFDMVLFASFVATALVLRRRKEAHKRLMLLAYVSIMAAPAARLPGLLPLGPFVFFGVAFVFVIAGAVYDFVSRGRVHPAYVWGGALFLISVPLRLMISSSAAWHAFAQIVTK